ncbi:hypothetical protein E1267_17515 [Nonomuraea longispora]|uniref:Uncharacterized protein n=1 Tax=Nonomuraea longispora TaxID=1848320 RepID=A0A4R4NB00_9ACTN|nr:hypothetical protein [Nonomuraea longispora]TDC06115.1 hypothetical protein E1267_17515 [Nonomuraea longispora]
MPNAALTDVGDDGSSSLPDPPRPPGLAAYTHSPPPRAGSRRLGEAHEGGSPLGHAPTPAARGRRATVVFRRGPGLRRLHLHETWLTAPPG